METLQLNQTLLDEYRAWLEGRKVYTADTVSYKHTCARRIARIFPLGLPLDKEAAFQGVDQTSGITPGNRSALRSEVSDLFRFCRQRTDQVREAV